MPPRHIILRQPHMEHLIDLPELTDMPDDELRALEQLMAFCVDQELEDPQAPDIRAYCALNDQSSADIEILGSAMRRLDMPEEFLVEVKEIAADVRYRAEFRGITNERNRDYVREVSVAIDALPADWQVTLRKFHSKHSAKAVGAPY